MSDISRSSVGGAPIERRLFSEGQLSVGLTLPLLSSGNIVADFDEQIALAKLSDEFGFSALWVRDVPLNSMDYPDPVGHLDPWVFLGSRQRTAHHSRPVADRGIRVFSAAWRVDTYPDDCCPFGWSERRLDCAQRYRVDDLSPGAEDAAHKAQYVESGG